MPVTCPDCETEHDEDTFEGFCEGCGEEFEADAAAGGGGGGGGSDDSDEDVDPYANIVVGSITEAEPVPKKANLTKLTVDVGGDEEIQVVTNAKHMEEGRLVVVARVGAKVGDVKITKTSVGGVKSEGMICDGAMLGWKGGAKGVAAKVPASFSPGDTPPRSKPKA